MPALGALLTAMVTPFGPDGSLDEDVAVTLMRHLADQGSEGLVLCGTTGENVTLTDDEQLRLLGLGVEIGREKGISIVAGAGSNDTRHAVELTERATDVGVDAILSVTPYYNKPNRRGLVAHFRAVAQATDRPVILYNIPSRTALDMPNDLLAELAQIDGISAVKQARASDLAPIDGLELYAGNDDMLCDVLELGGAGGICVASHLVGPRMRRMVDEPERRRELHDELRPLFAALAVTTNPIPIKAALNLLGLGVGGLRLPLVEADERETATIRSALEEAGLLAAGQPAPA